MRVLVVSPHADDETLGAGGYLLKLKDNGHEIAWLNMTDMDERYGYDISSVKLRQLQIETVSRYYDFNRTFNLKLPPAKLDKIGTSDLIEEVSIIIKDFKPEIIIVPYENDAHSDHGIVYRAIMACTKVFRYPFIKRILVMEVLSETNFAEPDYVFAPQYYVDISLYIDKKIDAFKIYQGENGEHPFPRSETALRAIAALRGAESGTLYAEAFKIIKWID